MWKRSEVANGHRFRLALCQSDDRRRSFSLVDLSAGATAGEHAVFETEEVPVDLLKQGNLIKIADSVKLQSGARFYVDAHGIWFTEDEIRDWKRGGTPDEVQWSTEAPPRLPPR